MRSFGLSIIMALTVLLALPSCLNRKAAEAMSLAETVMESAPDSALSVLESIDTLSLGSKAQRARFSLLYSMALDKNYIDTADTRLIMPAVSYYSRHGSPDDRMKSLYYLGRVQYNAGDYNSAIVSYTQASKCADESCDDKYSGLIYNSIGAVLSNTYSDIESKPYFDKALKRFSKLNNKDYAKETMLYLAYYEGGMRHWNSADSIYRMLLKDKSIDSEILSRALSGYALMLLDTPQPPFDKVDSLFSRQIAISGGLDDLNKWCAYAYTLAALGRASDSKQIMDQINPVSPREKGQYDYWNSRVAEKEGNYREAYSFLNSTIYIQDSLIAETMRNPAINVQRNYLELYESASMLRAERRGLLALLIVVAVLLILSLSVIILLLRKRALSKERDDYKTLSEASSMRAVRAESELSQNRKAMEALSHGLSTAVENRFGSLGVLKETLIRTEGLSKARVKDEVYQSVLEQIDKYLDGEDDSDKLENTLNEAYDNVLTKFRNDFPKVGKVDFKLFTCLVAGFDTSSIVRIMSAKSSDAVYMRKMRLKKRISDSGCERAGSYLKFF